MIGQQKTVQTRTKTWKHVNCVNVGSTHSFIAALKLHVTRGGGLKTHCIRQVTLGPSGQNRGRRHDENQNLCSKVTQDS
jgi:hypothetical protein